MMMKSVRLGTKELKKPIIQGGMGIGISRCRLAGAVAAEDCMGVISAAQIGYDEEDFIKHPEEANLRVLPEQIREAKQIAGGRGLIGVNIMSVTQDYEAYVKTVCEAGADAIISGAGLPLTLPRLTAGYDAAIAPIVSSRKAAGVILKYWDRKFSRTADFLIIEGPLAGGHLGFSREEIGRIGEIDYDEEIRQILEEKKKYEEKYETTIPVFAAGGCFDGNDARHLMALGADGIQSASRFITTMECDASENFKKMYLEASEEDIVIIDSPVGMPGRAIRNPFVRNAEERTGMISHCFNCLKGCNPKTAPYCITKALIDAVRGDVENGLFFCGARIGEIQEITTAAEVIRDLYV